MFYTNVSESIQHIKNDQINNEPKNLLTNVLYALSCSLKISYHISSIHYDVIFVVFQDWRIIKMPLLQLLLFFEGQLP